VLINTSSGRSPNALRFWLRLYGIKVAEVINQPTHERVVWRERRYPRCTKYPPAFGIDLHVDDSEGVEIEGRMHGFRVLVVSPDDREWVRRVLDAVGVPAADSHL